MGSDLSNQLASLYQCIDRSSSIQFLLNELLHASEDSVSLPSILKNLREITNLTDKEQPVFLKYLKDNLKIEEQLILNDIRALGLDNISEKITKIILEKIESKLNELIRDAPSSIAITNGHANLRQLDNSLNEYLKDPSSENKQRLQDAIQLPKNNLRPIPHDFNPLFLKKRESDDFKDIFQSPEFYRASLIEAASKILTLEHPNQESITKEFPTDNNPLSIFSSLNFNSAFENDLLHSASHATQILPQNIQTNINKLIGEFDTLQINDFKYSNPELKDSIDQMLLRKHDIQSKLIRLLEKYDSNYSGLITEAEHFKSEFSTFKKSIDFQIKEKINTLIEGQSDTLNQNMIFIDEELSKLERLKRNPLLDNTLPNNQLLEIIDRYKNHLTLNKEKLSNDTEEFKNLSNVANPSFISRIARKYKELSALSNDFSRLFEKSKETLSRLNSSISTFHHEIEQSLLKTQEDLTEKLEKQTIEMNTLRLNHERVQDVLRSKSDDFDKLDSSLKNLTSRISNISIDPNLLRSTEQNLSFSLTDAISKLYSLSMNLETQKRLIDELKSKHESEIEQLKEEHLQKIRELESSIKSQTNDIQLLSENINEKESQLSSLKETENANQEKLKKQDIELSSLKDKYAESLIDLNRYKETLDSLKEEQASTSNALLEKDNRINSLSKELSSKNEEIFLLTEKNNFLSSQIESVRRDAENSILEKTTEFQRKISQLEREFEIQEENFKRLNSERSEELTIAKNELSSLKKELKNNSNSLQEKENLLKETEGYLEEKKKELNAFELQKSDLESKLDSQSQLNQHLRKENNDLLALALLNQTKIEEQRKSINSIDFENSTLKKEIEEQARINEEKIIGLEKNLQSLQNAQGLLTNNNLSLERKLSLSENALTELKENNKKLSEDLISFKLKNNELEDNLSRVKNEYEQSIGQLQIELKQKTNELQLELARNPILLEESEELKRRIREIAKESDNTKATLKERQQNLEAAMLQLNSTREEVLTLNEKILQQRDQINDLRENISSQQDTIATLKQLIHDQENSFKDLGKSHINEKQELSKSIHSLKSQVNQFEQQVKRYQTEIQNLTAESSRSLQVKNLKIQELTQNINSQSLQIEQLNQNNQSLSNQLVQIKNEATQTIERKKIEFQEQIDNLTTKFQEQLKTAQSLNSLQKEKISTQIIELVLLKDQLLATNRSLADKEDLLKLTTNVLEEKNRELINLQTRLSSLESELENKNKIIKATELINQNLLERLKSEKQTTNSQLAQITLISGENTELKNQLRAQLQKISDMTDQIEQSQHKLNETKENLSIISENNIDLETKLKSADKTIGQLSIKNQYFETDILRLTNKNKEHVQEISALQNRVDQQNVRIRELEKQLGSQENNINSLRESIENQQAGFRRSFDIVNHENSELQLSIDRLKEILSFVENDHRQTQQQLQDLKSRSSSALQEKDQVIQLLDNKLLDQNAIINKLFHEQEATVHQLREAIEERDRQLEENTLLKTEIQTISKKNTENIRIIDNLTAQRLDDASLLTDLKYKLSTANTKLHELSSEKGNIQSSLKAIKKELEKARQDLTSARDGQGMANSEILRLKRSSSILQNAHAHHIAEKENELLRLTQILKDTESLSKTENDTLRREITRLTGELKISTQEKDRLTSDYSLLERELNRLTENKREQEITIADYLQDLQDQQRAILRFQELNMGLTKRNNELKADNLALTDLVREQSRSLEESLEKTRLAEQQNLFLRESIQTLNIQISEHEKIINSLQAQLRQTKDTGCSIATQLSLKIQSLTKAIKEKEKSIFYLNSKLDNFSDTNKKLSLQLIALKNQMAANNIDLSLLKARIQEYEQKEASEQSQQEKNRRLEITKVSKKISRLEKQIKDCPMTVVNRYQLEDIQKNLNRLKTKCTQLKSLTFIPNDTAKFEKIKNECSDLINLITKKIETAARATPTTTVTSQLLQNHPDPEINISSLFAPPPALLVPNTPLLENFAEKLTNSTAQYHFNFDQEQPAQSIKNAEGKIEQLKIFIKDSLTTQATALIQPNQANQFVDYLSVKEQNGAFVTSFNISSTAKKTLMNEATYQDKLNDFYELQAKSLEEAYEVADRSELAPAKIKFEITSIEDALELSSIFIALKKAELKAELDLTISKEGLSNLKKEISSITDPLKKELIEKLIEKHPSFSNLTQELTDILSRPASRISNKN